MKFSIVLSSLSLLSGCFSFQAHDVKNLNIKLKAPQDQWRRIDAGTADSAYKHIVDGATLSWNSVCDQYQSLSLAKLAENSAPSEPEMKSTVALEKTYGGLPALFIQYEFRTQGKELMMNNVTAKSSKCVYDFTLIAKKEVFLTM